jgi:hypothetical protein
VGMRSKGWRGRLRSELGARGIWPVADWALGYFHHSQARRYSSGSIDRRGPSPPSPFKYSKYFPKLNYFPTCKIGKVTSIDLKISKPDKVIENFK